MSYMIDSILGLRDSPSLSASLDGLAIPRARHEQDGCLHRSADEVSSIMSATERGEVPADQQRELPKEAISSSRRHRPSARSSSWRLRSWLSESLETREVAAWQRVCMGMRQCLGHVVYDRLEAKALNRRQALSAIPGRPGRTSKTRPPRSGAVQRRHGSRPHPVERRSAKRFD
jgi:hypothetical protein